jgi:methyl-accepting chemotaxis protein
LLGLSERDLAVVARWLPISDAIIRAIKQIVDQLRDYSGSVATAMEQQTASTAEISRNMGEVAAGIAEAVRSIRRVAEGAGRSGEASGHSLQAVTDLAGSAGRRAPWARRFFRQ